MRAESRRQMAARKLRKSPQSLERGICRFRFPQGILDLPAIRL